MKYLKLLFVLFLFTLLSHTISAQENTALLCADGIDNDGDGLIDCEDDNCISLPLANACAICPSGISFADVVLDYTSGCALTDPQPEGAVGAADWGVFTFIDSPQAVFLGEGGRLTLGFTDNLLANSEDDQQDLWIFEIGDVVEGTSLALRPADTATAIALVAAGIPQADNDGFFAFGNIGGATQGLDIDEIVPGFAAGTLVFDAVRMTDISGGCDSASPGADIDAICAVFSLSVDCAGVIDGTFVLDECGECLEPGSPDFNQSCLDCTGTPNGTAVTDDCGNCLEPDDPTFNQSCVDCAGILFGTAVIDSCGLCLEPSDAAFNQSCSDCAGIPNGTAIFDLCGVCLPSDSPDFNASCLQNKSIYIPSAFSPNDDGINDLFRIFKDETTLASVISYRIYDRWGELLFVSENFAFDESKNFWDGKFNGRETDNGVFVYVVEVRFGDDSSEIFAGDVSLLR